jgi:hypothetical protein
VLGEARAERVSLIESLRRFTNTTHDDHPDRPDFALALETGATLPESIATDLVAGEVLAA